jgi:hypothetical protein
LGISGGYDSSLAHRKRVAPISLGCHLDPDCPLECGVLAANGGRCPLSDLAARYTVDHASNFDIYLPNWLAEHNKVVFGWLFVAGELVVVGCWLKKRLAIQPGKLE